MSKINKLIFLLTLCFTTLKAGAFENLVYTWRGFPEQIMQGKIAIEDLKAHAAQIDILSSQAYHVNDKGTVYGAVNPQMLAIANEHHIKFMPLVGNSNFDRAMVDNFLNDPAVQDRAIQSILQLCKQNHYAGVQIDFEGMSFLNRDAFTKFYQKISQVLHQNNFQVAIAIIPTITENPPPTEYLKGRYEGWSGAYDYKALGASSDFVTLMAYDQHGGITTPGPMAGITWDEDILKIALKYIPAEKISLGIPWHSGYWYTSNSKPLRAVEVDLSYPETLQILKNNNVLLHWNDEDKVHYAIYKNHFLYEYLFVEDAESFKAKLDLVKKYKLRGISNWVLGEEDPKVWDLLKSHVSAK